MIVKQISTGRLFNTTQAVWDAAVVNRGLSHLFEVVESEIKPEEKPLSALRSIEFPEVKKRKKKND